MNPLIVPMEICPVAPTGVSAYTDQILSLIHISEPTRPY